ncbi:MAG: hypothetical protein JOZ39_05795 [Chloroflexi bacterium]|nr:hypothetical protein [Chloroflexota bacterium]
MSAETARLLGTLAQFSAKSDERQQALDLLSRHCGAAARPVLTRAALADADEGVRAYAAGRLQDLPA